MSKTLLIIIGIACAIIGAVGSIYFLTYDSEYRPREILLVTTCVVPTTNELDFSTNDESAPPITLTNNSNPITPFVIPGKISISKFVTGMNIQDVKNLEQLLLDRANKIIRQEDRQKGVKARSEIHVSSDYKLIKYQLYIHKDRYSGSFYSIKCRKDGDKWIIIDDGADTVGSFQMTHCFQEHY
ncbi:MAG: hypothetical protein AB1599_03535 [Planctomycetota bacterium]